jgi:Putative sugar-binding domain
VAGAVGDQLMAGAQESRTAIEPRTLMLDDPAAAHHSAAKPRSSKHSAGTTEQLRRIPEVLAVAGGVDKADAVSVVLHAGFVTTLITKASVAQQLLKQDRGAALT